MMSAVPTVHGKHSNNGQRAKARDVCRAGAGGLPPFAQCFVAAAVVWREWVAANGSRSASVVVRRGDSQGESCAMHAGGYLVSSAE
eukprot:1443166-Pyramimonas_sp.AAC.1